MAITYNLSDLQFADIMVDIRADTTAFVQGMTIEIVNILRGNPPEGTPIDTSWASNNWIPAIKKPPTEPYGQRPSSGVPFTDTRGVDAGIAELLTWNLGDGTVFVVNNVPYIERLNQDGHSPQSPKFFVERAIDKAFEETEFKQR